MRVEKAPTPEEAEHAALDGALKSVGVVGLEVRRLMEAVCPVVRLGEEAVEDHEGHVEEYDADAQVAWRILGNPGNVFPGQRIPSLYAPGLGSAR